MSRRDDLQTLISRNQRRLQKLKEQQATYGLVTPAHILIEIEDTETELAQLQAELATLPADEAEPPAQARGMTGADQETASPVKNVQIGGINLSGISGSPMTIGHTSANVTAGGDIVAGHKEVHYHYHSPPVEPAAEKPRQPFEPETILIPAGPFTMGSNEGEPYEKPAHTVILPAYYIGLYPVTNREFAAFIETTGKVIPSLGWPGQRPTPEQADLPVIGVSWYLALEYCAWLSQQSGRAYALPTEAEWEKAARGPDGRRYPWGNDWQEGRANADPTQMTPVNHYPAQSVYGCYDLVGNGREWTCSLWGSQPRQPEARFAYPQTAGQNDPAWRLDHPRHNLAANSQVRRIYRGGAGSTPDQLRCTLRRANLPDTKLDLNRHGLRVVRREA